MYFQYVASIKDVFWTKLLILTTGVFPRFRVSTRGLSPEPHSVSISFRDDELRSVTVSKLTVSYICTYSKLLLILG